MDTNGEKPLDKGTRSRPAVGSADGPLVTVLADMIRSALAWEAKMGHPTDQAGSVPERPSTGEQRPPLDPLDQC